MNHDDRLRTPRRAITALAIAACLAAGVARGGEPQAVMDAALSSIPAPCCDQYSIATCCCPCNLAKSTWGLSKLLIAQHGLNTPQVRAAVDEWLGFIGHGGFTGDACFTRGCNRAFDHNGCGGMDDTHIG